jgi:hypothetical protein
VRLGSLSIPWFRKDSRADDPYWDFFINTAPTDAANLVTEMIRNAPEGNVFPTKAELHTPEITSNHVKELARYLGAEMTGIVRLPENESETDKSFPFAVVCIVRAEYDPKQARGVGGQVPVQNGLFVTFVLSAWIRELGFRATAAVDVHAEKLAVAAKLGRLDGNGKLVTENLGSKVHVANIIRTDLPLAPDGQAISK